MQKSKLKLIFRITFLFIVLSLFTTSVVFGETFTPLKKDVFPNSKKASALVFGRIIMTSKFKEFNKAAGKNYVFKGSRTDDQKNFAMTIGIKTVSERWKGEADTWGYDSFFALTAEPGNYSFNSLSYNFEDFDLNDVIHSLQGYINSLTSPFEEEQTIEAGKLVYFGVINLTFVSFELTDQRQFYYRYDINVTNDFDNDLKKFQTAYPKLYEQFKDNIVTADFVGK